MDIQMPRTFEPDSCIGACYDNSLSGQVCALGNKCRSEKLSPEELLLIAESSHYSMKLYGEQ
jgi:hypothetical protein